MPPKYSFEFVKNKFNNEGCTLISTEYVNSSEPLDYKCSCGNEEVSQVSFGNFMRGTRCPKCRTARFEKSMIEKNGVKHHCEIPESKQKMIEKIKEAKLLKFADVKKIIEDKNCELLSSEYTGSKDKLSVKFDCGHIGEITLNKFQSGRRCNNRECVKRKKSETFMNNYADMINNDSNITNPQQLKVIRDKGIETSREKYGVDYYR